MQIGISTHLFTSDALLPGIIPIVVPPYFFAPRQTDSITPSSPPHTIMMPFLASNSPTSSASRDIFSVGFPSPITEIIKINPIYFYNLL